MSYDDPNAAKLPPAEVCAEMAERGIPINDPSAALRQIAKGITGNEHFCAFLLTVVDNRRKEAYDALCPHLSFKAWPFTMLMSRKKKVLRKMGRRLGFIPKARQG